jgi:hypothetical protein
VTAFPRDPVRVDQLPGWNQLLGTEPQIAQSLPRQGARIEAGPHQSGWVVLEANPVRIDWKFSPQPDAPSPSIWDTVGELAQAEATLRPLMQRWFRQSPPLYRVAFGAVLLKPVDDLAMGYHILGSMLPLIQLDPTGSSDFMYQINRRRRSKSDVRDLEINRLSKWSVAHRKTISMGISPSPSPADETGPGLYACRLELDINSVPISNRVIKKSHLPRLLDEFIELANEIAVEGDKP